LGARVFFIDGLLAFSWELVFRRLSAAFPWLGY
jgi:hypothetical protein